MLIPRIIKSEQCSICKGYLHRLEKQGHILIDEHTDKKSITNYDFCFLIYNADHPDNQAELDKWGIADMPVVQIVNTETWEVEHPFPHGPLSARSIRGKIREIERKQNDS